MKVAKDSKAAAQQWSNAQAGALLAATGIAAILFNAAAARAIFARGEGWFVALFFVAIWSVLAEGVGFEPTRGLHPWRFSRPLP